MDCKDKSATFELFLQEITGVRGYIQIFLYSILEFFNEFGIVEVNYLEGLNLCPNFELEFDFLRLVFTESLRKVNYPDCSILGGEQYWILIVGVYSWIIGLGLITVCLVYLGEARWVMDLLLWVLIKVDLSRSGDANLLIFCI